MSFWRVADEALDAIWASGSWPTAPARVSGFQVAFGELTLHGRRRTASSRC